MMHGMAYRKVEEVTYQSWKCADGVLRLKILKFNTVEFCFISFRGCTVLGVEWKMHILILFIDQFLA